MKTTLSEPKAITMSEELYRRVDGDFVVESRSEVEIKGFGPRTVHSPIGEARRA
jgi:hypothetical protein